MWQLNIGKYILSTNNTHQHLITACDIKGPVLQIILENRNIVQIC